MINKKIYGANASNHQESEKERPERMDHTHASELWHMNSRIAHNITV